jgi:GH35 family endo-1,4-beta-xylanase
MQALDRHVDFAVVDRAGAPVPADQSATAMVVDMEFLPAFTHKPKVSAGKVGLPVADGPFAVSIRMMVEGFGHVYVYADAGGRGYTAGDVAGRTLDFVLEAAVSRLDQVTRAESRLGGTGLSSDYHRHVAEARTLLDDARRATAAESRAQLATDALAGALQAGEMLAVERAQQRIAARPPRRAFRFGCNAFGYPKHGEPYARLFADALNFATLPFYRNMVEPAEGKRDYCQAQKILQWTQAAGIAVKGHPLIWENHAGLPSWLRGRSFPQICDAHRDYIADAVGRFRGQIDTWDVINEAHDWANDPRHSLEQLVELTRLACDATRQANPSAVRVVNNCCTWSEYVASAQCSAGALGRPGRSVLGYLRDVLADGVDFEVVGVQMYYPYRDLFEIDRHLDLFCALGKPVHITELGVSSSEAPRKSHIKMPVPRWHGHPWSEAQQADWIEGYYTICYAKEAIEAVTWWDFAEPAWYPHGALVDENLHPKAGYARMKHLVQLWR